jgi:hypothetical protein
VVSQLDRRSRGTTHQLVSNESPDRWTGVVAKRIQLFGLLDAEPVLKAGESASSRGIQGLVSRACSEGMKSCRQAEQRGRSCCGCFCGSACCTTVQADDRRATEAAGFDAHLTKPTDPDVLEALLNCERHRCADLRGEVRRWSSHSRRGRVTRAEAFKPVSVRQDRP